MLEGCARSDRFHCMNRWYRGQVLLAEAHQSEVFFVDYGDTEWVPNNLVQPIDASLLQVSHCINNIIMKRIYSCCC